MSDKIIIDVDNLNKVSDGYHTIEELYQHRQLLFIALVLALRERVISYVVYDHMPDWDLIVVEFCWGNPVYTPGKHIEQISYHVQTKHRIRYMGKIKKRTSDHHHYDGHDSNDVLMRLSKWIDDQPRLDD